MIIKHDPKAQLVHQLSNFYPDSVSNYEIEAIDYIYDNAVKSLEKCFSHVNNKYYHSNGETIFNPLHVAQYTMFLYQMSRHLCINNSENTDLCDKIYGISKMISSADIYYGVEMPDIWFFDHPQGSVIGRAQYGNFFTFSQGCTVGNNKGIYPRFGEHVSMMSGSKVLGDCQIGDYVILAANSYIIDQDVPPFSIVFGSSPNPIIHSITPEKFYQLTCSMFDGKLH